jgi:CHASE3 domain sensor protein
MNRKRLLERLDHMVESGQVTAEEAGRLRSATTDAEFEAATVAIRTRHASASMSAAVEAGQMTQAEADANLAGVRNGEHPRGLGAHVARLTRPAG